MEILGAYFRRAHFQPRCEIASCASRDSSCNCNLSLVIRVRSSKSSISWLSKSMLRRIIASAALDSLDSSGSGFERLQGRDHRCERRAQFMRKHREKIVLGLDSPLRPPLLFLDRGFGPPAFRHGRGQRHGSNREDGGPRLQNEQRLIFRRRCTNGPKPCSVPQIAMLARMKMPVAVSRGVKRKASQTTNRPVEKRDRIVFGGDRKPSAETNLGYGEQGKEKQADFHDLAARPVAASSRRTKAPSAARSRDRRSHPPATTSARSRGNCSTAAKPPSARLVTPRLGLMRVLTMTASANLKTLPGRSKAVGRRRRIGSRATRRKALRACSPTAMPRSFRCFPQL